MKTMHKALLSIAAGMAISVAGMATANADHMNIHHVKNAKKANADHMTNATAPVHSSMNIHHVRNAKKAK